MEWRQSMKVAVTYENGEVFQHFGRTPQFKIYEIENGEVKSSRVIHTGEDADFLPDEDGKEQPDMTSPAPLTHKNIRGREYYRKDKQ